MMKARFIILPAVLGVMLAAGGFLSAAQKDNQRATRVSNRDDKANHTARADSDQGEGESVFAAHCSRCHNAPESFSPRIAGTITRHMRVRANLTTEEERAVLKFLNP